MDTRSDSHEPTKHQYDFDVETIYGFLLANGLEKEVKMNIEANHATLAGHSFAHELQVSADANMLGSVDANRGDAQNGWDTDQFPTDIYETTSAMMVVLSAGGLGTGGLFTNNIQSPLVADKGVLLYNNTLEWDVKNIS